MAMIPWLNGRMTQGTAAFVRELGHRLARKRAAGGVDEQRWLMQRISVAVHGGNGRMLGKIGRIMDDQ